MTITIHDNPFAPRRQIGPYSVGVAVSDTGTVGYAWRHDNGRTGVVALRSRSADTPLTIETAQAFLGDLTVEMLDQCVASA